MFCSFQATFLLRGAELAPRDRNDDGGVGVAYAALSASGADDPLVLDAAASISPQIAAMKADRPTSRKIRAMPAWISPAVRVPGARQGAGRARPGTRAGAVKARIGRGVGVRGARRGGGGASRAGRAGWVKPSIWGFA